MTSVVVFDYGFGNVRSMVRALANLDQQVFDERRGGGEQHRWRERLADLALQVHRRLELVRTVDREDGRHAGDHGGQIFDGRFRSIAVEIA